MKIAFLGDSITFGYGLEDKSKKYSTLVSNALGLEEENFGITGTLVAKTGMNKADGKDFLSRLHLIKDADIAVVFGGTNDYFWSDEKIFGDTHDEKYFADAIESICKFFNEERKGKINLLVTPYSHNGVGNYLGGESHNTSSRHDTTEINYNGHVLRDYVKTMTDISKKYGVPCLDLHKDIDFDWRVHTLDGCHPNDEGHALLADAVTKALKALMNA